jgi:hypothetical protein
MQGRFLCVCIVLTGELLTPRHQQLNLMSEHYVMYRRYSGFCGVKSRSVMTPRCYPPAAVRCRA